ncbi:hypothetical protein RCG23_14300 [Neobacillus sp. PS3-34]|uniref:hypothetical protein n=1 Tax=Neobacillus sp. PS3-34 TaxID=3070678 RepID=UPI0027E16998|nr:hypothetical protein [Neobacillus sp. PS3-34]WML46809.1 hypothetical protein RCG23_14300 [Neobacillus sp. PS3-34]
MFIWPFPIANGGWVDYLRMGFGKQREFIYELARLSGVFSEVSDHGTRDQIAFHYVTQLQISLSEHGWSVNLYMDKSWLEQRNLYNKLQDKNSRKEFIHILDSLLQEGFISSIIYHDGSWEDFEDAREFLREFTNLVDQEESFSFLIGKHLERYSPENHAASILSWVKDQMQILLGAYNYTAWHPSANNYLEF